MSLLRSLSFFALVLFSSTTMLTGASSADEIAGKWKGRWSSGSTGHSGPMRARVTPTDNGTYKAVFAGRFAGVIPFIYRAEMVPVQTWDGITYKTEKRLPLLGSYQMQTAVHGNLLNANWSAVGDTGQVQMFRLQN